MSQSLFLFKWRQNTSFGLTPEADDIIDDDDDDL
jgi:hypothetical protein